MFYQYHKQINYYYKLFGKNNVLVLPYEELRLNEVIFADKIRSFCGSLSDKALSYEPKNTAMSGLTVTLKWRINRLLLRTALNPNGLFESRRLYRDIDRFFKNLNNALPAALGSLPDKRMARYIRTYTKGMYSDSNLKTSELIGRDLQNLGYD